ncbi:unnamed protein product (macronuclear) [Paramecium tetraurelia]|uniref:Protein kinase domain-containing protein n=1 Tax=Paramecium tetraurelia TaxID=5888 RepID=A0CVZ3_PARTE|nr:uncharacterized protein GSPATT00001162001 [Paramecium tetraurelia]CAK74960.1 unnamed protein product [Paramecium tetraurelia]|eukprot:XP_001442357.1 hypothetical protein (macronuclear) [Paramecium tetraurelia strain d4-2]
MLNEKVIGDYAYLISNEYKVGAGQFGHVYKGYHKITNKLVAIKQIDKKLVKGIYEQMLRHEIEILEQLNHQYIVKMYAHYETINNFYIVSEYCETDILSIIKQKGKINEDLVIMYVLQIAEALLYLNQKQIIHRDIKPSNILIHNGEVRLADFGFAIQQDKLKFEDRNLQVGSPLYMSPETLLKQEYNHKTDIWSLGILYFEMIFGVVPFFSMELDDLIRKLKQYQSDHVLVFSHAISVGSTEAIRNLLAYDPQNRCDLISLAQILQKYLRNRRQMTSSVHLDKRQITPQMKRRNTPEICSQNNSVIISGSKGLLKINTISAQKAFKQTTYYKINNQQEPKKIGEQQKNDANTSQKLGVIKQKDQNDIINMKNEDFLTFLIDKMENLKTIQFQEGLSKSLSECQLFLYQYYGRDQEKLKFIKEKLSNL